jgi:hypothetical protein
VVCAVLNGSASDPYRQEGSGEKQIATYFNRCTLQFVVMLQEAILLLKPAVLVLEVHNFHCTKGYM